MKLLWALGMMVLGSAACGAAPSAYYDFEVVSVVPRSPDVKPFVMSISARELPKNPASPQMGAFTPIVEKKGLAAPGRLSHP